MATVPVPIFQPVFKGVDGIELSDESFVLRDGYRTLSGGTTKRPGSLATFIANEASGFGFDGIAYWPDQDIAIAVGRGEIYKLTYNGDAAIITSMTGGTPLLDENTPVSIAFDSERFYVCNGGRIVYSTPSGTPAYIADADAPTNATHIAYLDGYLLAIDGSNKFYFSSVNDGLTWSALDFASATGAPDDVVSMRVFNREIYLLGQRTIEVWENDGTTPFSRIPGGMIECGCSAPHAVIADENSLYWLDHTRKLVRWNGKTVEALSTKYDKELQSLSYVTDATAFKVSLDGYIFFVFNFPSENRTLVYNQTVDDWSEWGEWDNATASYSRWIGNCYAYSERWGLHLLGRKDQLVVSELSADYADDDGETIRLVRTTGHIDNGTSKTKRCSELRFRARRGDGLATRTPKIMLRYKLDNRNWSNIKELSLGDVGEYEIILRDQRRYIYRTVQYEFSATDAVRVVFSKAEAEVEVLR